MIPSVFSLLTQITIEQSFSLSATSTPGLTPSPTSNPLIGFQIEMLIFTLLSVIATILVVPLGQAIAMPAKMGSFRQRYTRTMRPWALSLVGTRLVVVLLAILSSMLIILVNLVLAQLGINPLQSVDWVLGASFYSSIIVMLATVGYQSLMGIQAGSVGMAMGRWKVFLTYLVTSLALSTIVFLVMVPIFFVQLFNILSSISTTTTTIP